MFDRKYQELLFNLLFVVLFGLGCLIGSAAFFFSSGANGIWLCSYGKAVFQDGNHPVFWQFFSAFRPLLVLLTVSFLPWGNHIIPALIFIRGFFIGYYVCVCYASRTICSSILIHVLLMLPIYHLVCRWIFFGRPQHWEAL